MGRETRRRTDSSGPERELRVNARPYTVVGVLSENFTLPMADEALRVTGAGLLVGGAGAHFLTRLFESLLFGVASTDPRVMGSVALLLAAVAALACTVPARRATRVNPMEALEG